MSSVTLAADAATMPLRSEPRAEPLDHAERWLRDSLQVLRPPFSVLQSSVDMTHALQQLDELRRSGVSASTTHLLVRAAARALAAHPDLHQMIAGSQRHRPARVDIGLSVTGDTFVSPVLVLENADQKSVAMLAAEMTARVPEVRQEDKRKLEALRRWGRLAPWSFLRRALFRWLLTRAAFRRQMAGTFQVTTVPVDWGLSSVFVASGVLVAGQVCQRVVVVDGQPAVRPLMTLTLCADHGVWNGSDATRILAAIKTELEECAGIKMECR